MRFLCRLGILPHLRVCSSWNKSCVRASLTGKTLSLMEQKKQISCSEGVDVHDVQEYHKQRDKASSVESPSASSISSHDGSKSCERGDANTKPAENVPITGHSHTKKERQKHVPYTQHKGSKSGKLKGEEPELRHLRYRNQRDGKLPVPGLIDFQVVGCGRRGTPKSFIVNMDHFKYLFNCGEGLQRIVTEHRMRLTRIENIFFTHQSWDNIGGLLGMCLSMDTSKVPKLTFHGPPNVERMVTMSRGFAQMHNLNIGKHELSEKVYEDTAMRIEYVPLVPTDNSSDVSGEPDCKKRKTVGEEDNVAVAYICQPHPKQRSISFERIVDLNIPRNNTIRILKEGKDITLEDGRVIRAEDVLEPAIPNSPFFVVECPDETYLKALCDHPAWQKHRPPHVDPDDAPNIIIHLTCADVLNMAEYQTWMRGFGEKTRHLILNEEGSEVCQEGLYEIQAKLNLLHDDVFPLLPHQQQKELYQAKPSVDEKIVYGETNLRYIYRARKDLGYDRSACVDLNNENYREAVMGQVDFPQILQAAKKEIVKKKEDSSTIIGKEYPQIVFLGTGSTMPNKVRNVSAILVHLSTEQAVLLDCGENTIGQLWRHYGDKTPDLLTKLDAVYLSHLHADHHMGIVGVALEREKVLKKLSKEVTPLLLLAPGAMAGWWQSIDQSVLPVEHLVRLIPLEYFMPTLKADHPDEYQTVLTQLNLKEFGAVRVRHRQHPFGVAFTHQSGWKVAYSGDTMPCNEFVLLGSECDILLHEATMEDELEIEAKERNHSTTSQAIDVGLRMRAGFILLTHFSQRYAKVPIFNEKFSSHVGIAFDNMRVRPCDLPVLPIFTPVLKEMFAEDYAEMEGKTYKRKMRKNQ